MTTPSGSSHLGADEQLDVLIRCALRERVASAAPSSDAWERIQEGAMRLSILRRAWAWVRLGLAEKTGDDRPPREDGHLPLCGGVANCWIDSRSMRYDLHWAWWNQHQLLGQVC